MRASRKPKGTSVAATEVPWRSRVIIHTAANLDAGDYPVREATARIYASGTAGLPLHLRLADVLLPPRAGLGIYEALFRSHELLQEFLDRVSVVCYGKASLTNWFSTCPARAEVGQKFELASLDCHAFVAPAPVTPADLVPFSLQSEHSDLMHIAHLARLALSAKRTDEQFRHLFAILERIAEIETTEIIQEKCKVCKGTYPSGRKATGNYIKSLLLGFGISNSKAGRYIGLRGRIAHGGGPFDLKFAEAVTKACGELMGHVMSLVADRLGVTILRTDNLVTYLPMALYTCEFIEPLRIKYHKIEFKGTAAWPKVTKNAKVNEGGYSEFGLAFDPGMQPRIEPVAWPNIEIGAQPGMQQPHASESFEGGGEEEARTARNDA